MAGADTATRIALGAFMALPVIIVLFTVFSLYDALGSKESLLATRAMQLTTMAMSVWLLLGRNKDTTTLGDLK
jgi:hypothetical protein